MRDPSIPFRPEGSRRDPPDSRRHPGSLGPESAASQPSELSRAFGPVPALDEDVAAPRAPLQVAAYAGQIFDTTMAEHARWPRAAKIARCLYAQWCWSVPGPPDVRHRVAGRRAQSLRALPQARRTVVLERVLFPFDGGRSLDVLARELREWDVPTARAAGGRVAAVMLYVPDSAWKAAPPAAGRWNCLPTKRQWREVSARVAEAARAADPAAPPPYVVPMVMPQHFRPRSGPGSDPAGNMDPAALEAMRASGGLRAVCIEVPGTVEGWVGQGLEAFVRWAGAAGLEAWILVYPGDRMRPEPDVPLACARVLARIRGVVDERRASGKPGPAILVVPANYDERDHQCTAAPEETRPGSRVLGNSCAAACLSLARETLLT